MPDLSILNDAQREAVCAGDNNLLVIAGAGSGKTRTIIYRLAELAERGVAPHSMLLLTFTKKAAQEMLHRASTLFGFELAGIQGGTFHAFAYGLLRQYPPAWAKNSINILDSSDSASIISQMRDTHKIAKGDRSFPKNQKIMSMISQARNKELELGEVVRRENHHLMAYIDDLQELSEHYYHYKREHSLVDYDDLLFELEDALRTNEGLRDYVQSRYKHIMVDEYQDTNKVQARLVRLFAGDTGHVMAVGDDAQSIYAFRGADVQNILDFPKIFPKTQIVRLEENYRSVQPILDIANEILASAPSGFQKNLFSERPFDTFNCSVKMYRPLNDFSQARLVAKKVAELLEKTRPSEIAVLFRAGYQSYHLEVELNKIGISFRKYGAGRFTDAAHIKDILAYARLLVNPMDLPAFERVASFSKGVGAKTAHKIFNLLVQGEDVALEKACTKYPNLWEDIKMIASLYGKNLQPDYILRTLIDHYQPRMELLYSDDWPRRQQGLDELVSLSMRHVDLIGFMGDLSLENPEQEEVYEEEKVILSTVHSAKGLEWEHVFVIDLVEDRFPSYHAMIRGEDYEEERRLLYVACTRAKDSLNLFVPQKLFQRNQGGEELATPNPFIREIRPHYYEEHFEQYGGVFVNRREKPRDFNQGSQDSQGSYESSQSSYASSSCGQSASQRGMGQNGQASPRSARFHASQVSYTPSTSFSAVNSLGQSSPFDKNAFFDERNNSSEYKSNSQESYSPLATKQLGFCKHRVFGRGKIIEELDEEKVRVNFTGFGLKVIMRTYLEME